jgi:hypothetical protein
VKVSNAALRSTRPRILKESVKSERNGTALEKAVWILGENDRPRRMPVVTGETDGTSTAFFKTT